MANIRPNIRQHPLLSRYPGSEYSVGYSPGTLASACAPWDHGWVFRVYHYAAAAAVGDVDPSGSSGTVGGCLPAGADYICQCMCPMCVEETTLSDTGDIFEIVYDNIVKVGKCWGVGKCCSIVFILGCSWRVVFRRCRRWMVIIELLQLGLLCFLVGAINNFICLIRVWLFHVFCLYWWACRWSSWCFGGNKWRLALVIRWAGWRYEPGNAGDTFRILRFVWLFFRGRILKYSWELSLDMFKRIVIFDVCVLHETCCGIMLDFVRLCLT